MTSTHYDLVVVGTGSGNTIVDRRFAGWRVAIVERWTYGGTCLNRGCIPSKMYVATADHAHDAADGARFDLDTSFDSADWPAIRDRIFGRVDLLAASGRSYREGQEHVDALAGTARFTGPRALTVDLEDGGSVDLTADHVVLATGSRPIVPDIPGLDEVEHHTSDTVLRLETLPARIGILGGGYIGAELAHVFSSLGSRVVQVDAAKTLLKRHDADIAQAYTAEAATRWDVRLGVELARVTGHDDATTTLHLSDGSSIDVDALLLAVGRRRNSDLVDVARGGVDVDERGRILVDQHQRTSAEGVWALGDASSPEPLKHVANQDARVIQHNLLHPDDLVVSDHRFVPAAVFTHPQVATVGLTEEQARDQGLDVAVVRQHYADIAHGWALREDDPISENHQAKLLADRATGRLVGAHLIGPQASNLIQPLVQAMSFDQPVRGLARGQYWIHPALSEVVENALLKLEAELDS
ncbi:mycothione reductase [Nocardioides dongxiaopingii]|uniref:mycothione reductase n=1 Tax=Nocardioides dongxiaopingii TaxID=2576036 RepID=UPI0010C7635A|nr:mycothione reductase [Nocardioides dongxiaopingii]